MRSSCAQRSMLHSAFAKNLFSRQIILLTTVFLRFSTLVGAQDDSGATSSFVFLTEQSTVVQSGGFAGVRDTYPIQGQFQLAVDVNTGMASFAALNANLLNPTDFLPTLSLGELFNMTELEGTVVNDALIEFRGKTADNTNTDIALKLTLTDKAVQLTGQTVPPLGSADFFIFDVNAVAQKQYDGGTGEPNDPYQIATAEDLIRLGETAEDYSKDFILTADIDLDPNLPGRKVFDKAVIAPDTDREYGFQGTSFTGVFNGNGHAIWHLAIEAKDYVGLFGQLGLGARISSLSLEAVDVNGTGDQVGALVGNNYEGLVTSCYSNGTVRGNDDVGGLVGQNWNRITMSHSTATVIGAAAAGGLVGMNRHGSIAMSYSTGAVAGDYEAGGLVGDNLFGVVADCYSTGVVTGEYRIGGLVGSSYGGRTTTSFWDVQTSGLPTSYGGGSGKTTVRMQSASLFLEAGWDFVDETENGTADIWWILEGQDYPRLSQDWSRQWNFAQTYTKVWGKDGDLWRPEDRTLLDFSSAGYHEGKNDYPDWDIGVNVKDFGAQGDGIIDDTQAFQNAIKACARNRVVFIPSGTYKLTDWLGVKEMIGHWVRPNPKSNYALRGAGSDKTTLLLGVGLQQIHPWDQTTGHGRPTTQWSWWGGFLWFQDSIEVGVENLTIKGGGEQYGIHWGEKGYNGIALRNVKHAWIRNVRFVNVDSGIFVRNSKYVTIENILFESAPWWPSRSRFEDNRGMSGHHAIDFGNGSAYCVADKITFKNQFHHELGLSHGANHCVYSNCQGPNLHFDFHTQEDDLPNNLFTQINAGRGNLIWRNNFYGACTGAVLWNITGQQLSLPFERSWVNHPVKVEDLRTLLVGWPIDLPTRQEIGRPWFEDIPPQEIHPQNIYYAQRIKRLAKK